MLYLKAALVLALVSLALATTSFSVGGAVDSVQILDQILQLKESVDASAKEQWEALQSLRFHLLSARTGLKQALNEIEELRKEVKGCRDVANITELLPPLLPQDTLTTTPAVAEAAAATAAACRWPGETVGQRCLIFVTDELRTWHDAQQHCRSLGGSLASAEGFDRLRDYLTELFGVDSEARVRWSMWTGARQDVSGWGWAANGCEVAPLEGSVWAEYQPHASTALHVTQHCMALDGFADYKGVAVPCTSLRRFVCDIS